MQCNIYARRYMSCCLLCKKPINSNVCICAAVVCRWTWKFNRMHRNAMRMWKCVCTDHQMSQFAPLSLLRAFIHLLNKFYLLIVFMSKFFCIDAIICCHYQHKLNTYWIDCFVLLNWIHNSILFGQIAIYIYERTHGVWWYILCGFP